MDIKILESLSKVEIDQGNLMNHHYQIIQKRITVEGQGDGVPKAGRQQAAADS